MGNGRFENREIKFNSLMKNIYALNAIGI